MTTFNDEFYRDILEGIAVHAGNAFYRDILDAITRHQAPEIGIALNKNQMASKRWLADALFDAGGPRLGRVLILGGWVGALGAVLLSVLVHQKLYMLASTENAKDLNELRDLIETEQVMPSVDRTYPLAETADAIRHVKEGRAKGKVVITV